MHGRMDGNQKLWQRNCEQFIANSPWDEQAVWRAIRQEVAPGLEPLVAWIVDETGWLKQGNKTVGVFHQYCGAAGKQAKCQVSVEVVVSDGDIAAPVAARLYLPRSCAQDGSRRAARRSPAGSKVSDQADDGARTDPGSPGGRGQSRARVGR